MLVVNLFLWFYLYIPLLTTVTCQQAIVRLTCFDPSVTLYLRQKTIVLLIFMTSKVWLLCMVLENVCVNRYKMSEEENDGKRYKCRYLENNNLKKLLKLLFLDSTDTKRDTSKTRICVPHSLIDTWPSYCVATDLVLNQGVVSTEELQTVADPQYILTPPRLLLRPVGGQPLPHGQLHQLCGSAGWWHLQTGWVLWDKTGKQREIDWSVYSGSKLKLQPL